MIPKKLKMKNFMCYKDSVPELSFEGIHIACLCGDNGHGKSAIFDAMTWAIWGQSRAKSDDDLIYIGQKETEVELEFTHVNQIYRIIRKRIKKEGKSRQGQSTLEFQILNNDIYKTITGNIISDTQQKIIDLLHMDYDTFVNSAFLRQGNADEFSNRKPAERKEVLSNILGLSVYDEYENRAKLLVQQQRNLIDSLEMSNQNNIAQIANKDELIGSIEKQSNELINIQSIKQAQEDKLSHLSKKKQELELKNKELLNIDSRLNELKDVLAKWKAKRTEIVKRIKDNELLLEQKDDIEKNYEVLLAAREIDNKLNSQLADVLKLSQIKNRIENILAQEENKLRNQLEKIEEAIRVKEDKTNQIPVLESQISIINNDLLKQDDIEKKINNKKADLKDLLSSISYLKSVQKQYEMEIKDREEKIKLLGTEKSRCPLCNSELKTSELEQLKINLNKEISEKKEQKAAAGNEMLIKMQEANIKENEIRSEDSLIRKNMSALQHKLGMLQKQLEEANSAGDELKGDYIRLEEVKGVVNNKQYLLTEQDELNNIQLELSRINYKNDVHEKQRQEILRLSKYEKLYENLTKARLLINADNNSLREVEGFISDVEAAIKLNEEMYQSLRSEVVQLHELIGGLIGIEDEYKITLQKEIEARDLLAVAQERLRKTHELEKLIKENEDRCISLRMQESIYRELSEAFSKKGVQALLIKQAFPEIEVEANKLLNKMTDNRLSLILESQKELKSKKGEVIETLDIKISDELGSRKYEMFSGGESFRIDLALRIALSKLLVRRAGATLPILIIDEGFGTQDVMGRERLIEAIKSIEDDFEKIFVITHLEELKDYFPVTISVIKTSEGSTISIN